jgi:hypothetical protein
VALQIAHWIRTEGISDSAAGMLAGVSTSSLSRWKQEHEELELLLGQARAQYELERLRQIRETVKRDGSPDWRAQAWLLQQSSPETYGAPSRRRQASADAKAREEAASAAANNPFVVTPEMLEPLQQRRMEVLARMQAAEDEEKGVAGKAAQAGAAAAVDARRGTGVQNVTNLPETPASAGQRAQGAARQEGVAGARQHGSGTVAASPREAAGEVVRNVTIVPETPVGPRGEAEGNGVSRRQD